MVLTRIQWNLIGPSVISGSTGTVTKSDFLLNVISLVGQSSYWDVETTDTTGSNVEAIVLAPKSGATSGLRILLTGNFSNSSFEYFQIRQAGTPETYDSAYIWGGFTPDITENGGGSYTPGHYESDIPFGANVRWSKYWATQPFQNQTHMFLIESSESLCVVTRNTNGGTTDLFPALFGAIVAGYDADSSENGRVFGMFTSAATPIAANVHAVSNGWPGNVSAATVAKAGVFAVSGGVAHDEWQLVEKTFTFTPTADFPGNTSTNDGGIIGLSIPLQTTTNARAVGHVRQLYMHQDRYMVPVGLIVSGTNSAISQIVGVGLSSQINSTSDCFLFMSSGSFGDA